MSVETSLVAKAKAHSGLNGLIAGRFYADEAPQEATTPYVVFLRVSTVIPHAMGVKVSPERARFQMDLYASGPKTALTDLYDQVMACFDRCGSTGNIQDILSENVGDGNQGVVLQGTLTQLWRRQVDFMVIYTP